MSEIKKLLGRRIKEIRTLKGFTQERLSELTDIGASSLSKIESGYFHPTDENLEKICNALDVEPYQLYMANHLKNAKELKSELHNIIDSADDEKIKIMYKVINSIRY